MVPFVISPEKALTWVNAFYIAAVAVVAIGTFAIYRLSATINASKDRELARFQAQSQAEIALANERAEQARAAAAVAAEGQKKLEAETEKARARQKELEVQAQSLRNEQEQLRRHNLELQSQVEKERLARLQLEKSLEPRTIAPEVGTRMIGHLRGCSGQKIQLIWFITSPEISALAGQINSILIHSGWMVFQAPKERLTALPQGVCLSTAENATARTVAAAVALREALRLGELDVTDCVAWGGVLPIATFKDMAGTTVKAENASPTEVINLWIGTK